MYKTGPKSGSKIFKKKTFPKRKIKFREYRNEFCVLKKINSFKSILSTRDSLGFVSFAFSMQNLYFPKGQIPIFKDFWWKSDGRSRCCCCCLLLPLLLLLLLLFMLLLPNVDFSWKYMVPKRLIDRLQYCCGWTSCCQYIKYMKLHYSLICFWGSSQNDNGWVISPKLSDKWRRVGAEHAFVRSPPRILSLRKVPKYTSLLCVRACVRALARVYVCVCVCVCVFVHGRTGRGPLI